MWAWVHRCLMSPTQEPTDCRLTFSPASACPLVDDCGKAWESAWGSLWGLRNGSLRAGLPQPCSGLRQALCQFPGESGLCVGCYEVSLGRTPSFPVSFSPFSSTSAHLDTQLASTFPCAIPTWDMLFIQRTNYSSFGSCKPQRTNTEWRYWTHSHCSSPLCLPYVPIPIHLFVRYLLDAEPSARPLRHRRNGAKVPAWRSSGREKGQFIHQSPCDEAHATEKTTALCCGAKAVGAEAFGFVVDSRHNKVSPTTALFKWLRKVNEAGTGRPDTTHLYNTLAMLHVFISAQVTVIWLSQPVWMLLRGGRQHHEFS